MNLARPHLLILLLGVIFIYVILRVTGRREKKRWKVWHLDVAVFSWPMMLLLSAVYALFVIALAGPRGGFTEREMDAQGVDVVIALDVSSSMLARDIPPDRLSFAKRFIRDLTVLQPTSRYGLVVFAGDAFLSCPLTTDTQALLGFLSDVDQDLIPVPGTDFAKALQLAARVFGEGNKSSVASGVLVILTDGEDHGENIAAPLKELRDRGVRVASVAIGSVAGAPIPGRDGSYKKDDSGKIILSKPNAAALRELAAATGGVQIQITGPQSTAALQTVGQLIGSGSATLSGKKMVRVWDEWGGHTLLVIFILLLVHWLWQQQSATKRVRSISALLLLLSACLIMRPLPTYASIATYNEGVKAFQQGDYAAAQEKFTQAAADSSSEVAAASLYNLGNTMVAQNKLEEALAAYEKSLELQGKDQDTTDNRDWVKKQLEEKKKQEQNQQQKDEKEQNKNDENKKDQTEKNEQQKNDEKKNDQQPQPSAGASPSASPSPGAQGQASPSPAASASPQASPAPGAQASPTPAPSPSPAKKAQDKLLRTIPDRMVRPQMMEPQNPTAPGGKDW